MMDFVIFISDDFVSEPILGFWLQIRFGKHQFGIWPIWETPIWEIGDFGFEGSKS